MSAAPAFEPITFDLERWMALQGLEVVGAIWGTDYPVIYTRRVAGPPLRPCGFCGHAEATHENGGACLARGCACEVYTPPLGEGN